MIKGKGLLTPIQREVMLADFYPPELKRAFQQLAMDLMSRLTARPQ